MEKTVSIFAERLDDAMKDKRISQYSLAKMLGIPQSTISRYLSGKREISICYLVSICKVLNVSADYLLGLKDFS